jgi:hypothetical protein
MLTLPLEISLKGSSAVLRLLLLIHVLGALALTQLQVGVLLHCTAYVLWGASLCSSWRWVGRQAGVRVLLLPDGEIRLSRPGESTTVVAEQGGVVSVVDFGVVIWLTWRRELGRRGSCYVRLMIAQDAVPVSQWRPLRIWARHCLGSSVTDTSGDSA